MSEPQDLHTSTVISLLDRLPPPRRARHLATLALRDRVPNHDELAALTDMAASLSGYDPDDMLATLDEAPAALPDIDALKAGVLSLRALKRYLAGDTPGALADWAAAIERRPEHAAEAHRTRALVRFITGDLDAALDDLNRLIELEPRGAWGYSRRGDVYRKQERYPEARANYLRAAQLDPDDLHASACLGRCLLHEDEWAQALPWYSRAIKHSAPTAMLYIGRALCLENLDRGVEAVADLDRAIALDPDDALTFDARARCRPDDQRAEAIADLSRSLELDDARAEARYLRSRLYIKDLAFKAALDDLDAAIALDPEAPEARFLRATLLHASGRVAEAIADYDVAARLCPTDIMYVSARLVARTALGDRAGLRADLDAVVVLRPTDPELQATHAGLLVREGAYEQALTHADASLVLGGPPDDDARAELHHVHATALRALGRLDEACAAEELAVALAPTVARYRSWLGMYRSRLDGQEHLAEADMTLAVELAPDDFSIVFQRAAYYGYVGRWHAALADLDRVITLAPPAGMLHFQRGVARWNASDEPEGYRAARTDFDRAIELDGDDAEVFTWRGEAHLSLDDPRAALDDAECALALEPDSGQALYVRARAWGALGDAAAARSDLARSAALEWPEAVEAADELSRG